MLLTITERLGLPKGDKEAFAFMERYERADYRQKRSIKTTLEIRREKWELHEQWLRAVSDMPEEELTEESKMKHQELLNFIRTVKLPYKFDKKLNITVEKEHERRESDETRIGLYLQILRASNVPGPELEMKVLDAGYASLYRYYSLSAEDQLWNHIHPIKKVNQANLVTFRTIRIDCPARNTAGHTKEQNSIWQARINTALKEIERLIPERELHSLTRLERLISQRKILDDKSNLPELVSDDSSVESDSGYSNNGSASTRCTNEEDIQTAENMIDENDLGYSSIDEDHRRTAGSNKKAKP